MLISESNSGMGHPYKEMATSILSRLFSSAPLLASSRDTLTVFCVTSSTSITVTVFGSIFLGIVLSQLQADFPSRVLVPVGGPHRDRHAFALGTDFHPDLGRFEFK